MNRKEIFLIPYAHLDTQWRWEYPTTIKKYLKNTLERNIYLFDKYTEYTFNFTGSLRYEMMKEYYPYHFEKIKQLIKEDRWHIAGTGLEETDALIPSVESMIRNVLYGDQWFKKEFGKSSRDYMIPDCFGFPANIPTILNHCGIIGFSTQKLTWNSSVGIPFELGIWEGLDGSKLVSALNPCAYVSRLFPIVQRSWRRLRRLNNLGKRNGIWKSFQYYGVGDIGGAPKESSVKRAISSMNLSKKQHNGLIIKQGSPDQFFTGLTGDEKRKMDIYKGDLLLINHSAGSLTSAAIMKRWNRKNEQMAFTAEMAAVSSSWAHNVRYPQEKIQSAWYRTIGSQMHDILPGTCTPTAYEFSYNDEIIALSTWNSILLDSAQIIAPLINGRGEILLFNPLPMDRDELVDVLIHKPNFINKEKMRILDSAGNTYPIQVKKHENGDISISFKPKLKPVSWSRFSLVHLEKLDKIIEPHNRNLNQEQNVKIKEENLVYLMENAFYRIRITKRGKIESIYHKKLRKELLKAPIAYEFQKEQPRMFPAWNMDWKDRKKKSFARIEGGDEVTVIENGAIRCVIRITSNFQSSKSSNPSRFVKDVILEKNSELVKFIERIHWRESGCSLKLALSVNQNAPDVTSNWETCRMTRNVNNSKLFEFPSRYWIDISDNNGGISLIEDCKYGFDRPDENTIRMTLLYTPGLELIQGFRDQKSQDWGDHTIKYAIYAHEGDFRSTDMVARRFNQPIRAFLIFDKKSEESQFSNPFSLFSVSNPQMGILAVKKPEKEDGILIRVYERYGKECNSDFHFYAHILKVVEVNGLEEFISDIPFEKDKFSVNLKANGVRSFIVNVEKSSFSQKVKQKPLKLEYNCRLIGENGDLQALFPAEITPAEIKAGIVSYILYPNYNLNTLKCNGQKINNIQGFNTLSLLIGAVDEKNAVFKWLDSKGNVIKKESQMVSAITGFIGQWDTRIWAKTPTHQTKLKRDYIWLNKCVGIKPGFVNRNRLEWYSTHTHKNGADDPYKFGYMYTINLNIPDNAEALLLPTDEQIFVFATTLSLQKCKIISAQVLSDKYDY